MRQAYTWSSSTFFTDARAKQHRNDGSINLSGTIHCAQNGKKIGHFDRRFVKSRAGWHAEHKAFFVTDPSFQRKGIGRLMFSRAVQLYVPNGVHKISLDAVQDGRFLWLHYGFRPEPATLHELHGAFRRTYRKHSKRRGEIPRHVKLPNHGPALADYRYGGVSVGVLTLSQTESISLTLDLISKRVRAGLILKGFIPPWYLFS